MTIDIMRAQQRGQFDFGWLKTAHTFSFANYFNPERMGFGHLRVVNDDWVAPGKGFGTHPHRDMEILSIPLKGSLKHKDTLGHEHTIQAGEVQLMSAGTGIAHSEFNGSEESEVNFLQIWIHPTQTGLEPSYQQKSIGSTENKWETLVSPDGRDDSLRIHQDAFVSMIQSDQPSIHYQLFDEEHGVFAFILEGEVGIEGGWLSPRDAVMLEDIESVEFKTRGISKILMIETPVDKTGTW